MLAGLAAAITTTIAVVFAVRHRRLIAALDRAAAEAETEPGDEPIGSLLDAIMAERSTSRELATSIGIYESALAGAGFGMLVVDVRGDITFANPIARQYIGARHGSAVAEARIRDLLGEVARTGSEQSLALELYTPNRRYLGLHALPLDGEDGADGQGVVLYLEDLSERRRVESMRRDFVANASHELKTPLGALRVLAETLAGTEDEEVRERLSGRVQDESVRLSRLVDDILNLALVEGAASDLSRVSIEEVIDEALRDVALLSKSKGIDVRTAVEDNGLAVAGDRTQLVSAFSNLLENAIKYTAVGRREDDIPVLVRASRDNGEVVIVFEDHGIGIPEQHQHRVFERFYRVDRARSRATGGTGLGLSIVRHVVENHGGKIDLVSAPGVGSRFIVRLPAWEV